MKGPLDFYTQLLHLMSALCRGKATFEEVVCKDLLTRGTDQSVMGDEGRYLRLKELIKRIDNLGIAWPVRL